MIGITFSAACIRGNRLAQKYDPNGKDEYTESVLFNGFTTTPEIAAKYKLLKDSFETSRQHLKGHSHFISYLVETVANLHQSQETLPSGVPQEHIRFMAEMAELGIAGIEREPHMGNYEEIISTSRELVIQPGSFAMFVGNHQHREALARRITPHAKTTVLLPLTLQGPSGEHRIDPLDELALKNFFATPTARKGYKLCARDHDHPLDEDDMDWSYRQTFQVYGYFSPSGYLSRRFAIVSDQCAIVEIEIGSKQPSVAIRYGLPAKSDEFRVKRFIQDFICEVDFTPFMVGKPSLYLQA